MRQAQTVAGEQPGERSAAREPLPAGVRANARGRAGRRLAVRAATRCARQPRARAVRMQRPRPRADAPVLLRLLIRRLANRPAHYQEQRDDRDLQEQHQPQEGPSVHRQRSYNGRRVRTSPGSARRVGGERERCAHGRRPRSLAKTDSCRTKVWTRSRTHFETVAPPAGLYVQKTGVGRGFNPRTEGTSAGMQHLARLIRPGQQHPVAVT